jgi:hypothetical protein
LLENPGPFVKESSKSPQDFVREPEILKFFMQDIDDLLSQYHPGKPEHKPDVLNQIAELKKQREAQMQQQQMQQQQQIQISFANYEENIRRLTAENVALKTQNDYLQKKITELIQSSLRSKREIMSELKSNV